MGRNSKSVKKHVLVFGGTGFIGESVVPALIKAGFHPVVIKHNQNFVNKSAQINFVNGDASNP